MRRRRMSPLEHLFNNHEYCDSSWCVHKKREDEAAIRFFPKIIHSRSCRAQQICTTEPRSTITISHPMAITHPVRMCLTEP